MQQQATEYFFLDTNTLLHYKLIKEIDWLSFTDMPAVTLLIAPIVIKELDTHKYSPKKGIQKRAKKIINYLESCLDSQHKQIRDNVSIELIRSQPPTSYYGNNLLNPDINDDMLIASILYYRETNNKTLRLVSNDLGLKIKGAAYNINTIKLDDCFRETLEKDEELKIINDLKREILALQDNRAKLDLHFNNDQDYKNFEIKDTLINENYIANEITKLKKLYPLAIYTPNLATSMLQSLGDIVKMRYDDYNKNLIKYYNDYKDYLSNFINWKKESNLTLAIDFLLKNIGKLPAKKIILTLHFPDGFLVLERDKVKKEPRAPNVPELDLSIESIFNPLHKITQAYPFNFVPKASDNSNTNLSKPKIIRGNSYTVILDIRELMHTKSLEIKSLAIRFINYEEAKGFPITYKVIAENIPDEITGTLNVLLTKNAKVYG